MLSAEEVDDDFFAPVAGASLATLFGKTSKSSDVPENETLKYVPPKPQNVNTKPAQKKTTECIFADVVTAHEWDENQYKSRGRLGFAVIKYLETGQHRIILYESDKTTVSHTILVPDLEITIKNNSHISFYDNQQKYWSLYPKQQKLQAIITCLEDFGLKIKYCTYKDNAFTFTNQEPPIITEDNDVKPPSQQNDKKDLESDTDSSSINMKTKAAILQRMAHMGQSVLPPNSLPLEKSSSSSSVSSKTDDQSKTVRHKPVKNTYKKTDAQSIKPESLCLTESIQSLTPQNNQFLPLANATFVTGANADMNLFMSEQRINNSEMRININRITDKVDLVLDKINHQNKDISNNIQTDILMKLLTEYENKIKVYEEIFHSHSKEWKTSTDDTIIKTLILNQTNEATSTKVSELEKIKTDKEIEISQLQEETIRLKQEIEQGKQNKASKEDELYKQIHNLESSLITKNEEIENFTKKLDSLPTDTNTNNVADKVKTIMNDTFQTISSNFEDSDVYTGVNVKKVVGAVIKKMTISALHQL